MYNVAIRDRLGREFEHHTYDTEYEARMSAISLLKFFGHSAIITNTFGETIAMVPRG
jgi:hypothetical protein